MSKYQTKQLTRTRLVGDLVEFFKRISKIVLKKYLFIIFELVVEFLKGTEYLNLLLGVSFLIESTNFVLDLDLGQL